MKTCKNPSCKKRFATQYSSLQKTCSIECAAALAKLEREKDEKQNWTREKKERKEKLMTASDWRNLLQIAFNTYIRARDKHKRCISCNNPLSGKFDAGHYFTVGSYPNLRYDEDNCFGQCVQCNRDKHGNLTEYSIRIIDRIGQDKFEALKERRKEKLKLSIPEIQDLIKEYKQKTKQLNA